MKKEELRKPRKLCVRKGRLEMIDKSSVKEYLIDWQRKLGASDVDVVIIPWLEWTKHLNYYDSLREAVAPDYAWEIKWKKRRSLQEYIGDLFSSKRIYQYIQSRKTGE